ncbi:Arginine N-methyltransferase 2 [Loxospora ochrophaea]|nr:Arginine N-methyltransferase 2 [Loxospora ochrophaea]
MEIDSLQEPDPETEVQLILLSASRHLLEPLRSLLRKGSANVQDPDTGFTPLHTAIAACESISPSFDDGNEASGSLIISNGNVSGTEVNEEGSISNQVEVDLEAAAKTLRLLLQNGAIWNATDKINETPGCLARRLGLKSLYDIMVDAGVRAEMLLNRLDGYQLLGEGEGEEDDGGRTGSEAEEEGTGLKEPEGVESSEDPRHLSSTIEPTANENRADVNNEDYLRSDLKFEPDRILDGDNNGVMMTWEADIMHRTADVLATKPNPRILNIGHGMGIIDTFFQNKSPSAHHIIEAHPAVLAQMKQRGWYDKPGVTVHEGKWQDVIPKLMAESAPFDVIYYDPFAEEYNSLRDFFSDYVVGLLEDDGKWGFFHGLGADRQICYDIYSIIAEMDLCEAGYDVEWKTVKVPDLEKLEEWKGVKRRYWVLEEYKLPVCTFTG